MILYYVYTIHVVCTQPYLVNTVDRINVFFSNYDKEKKLGIPNVKDITIFAIYVIMKVMNIRVLVAPMVFIEESTKLFMTLSLQKNI